jgi:hypothetical protein
MFGGDGIFLPVQFPPTSTPHTSWTVSYREVGQRHFLPKMVILGQASTVSDSSHYDLLHV